jgi:hypothetical protein
MFVKCYTLIKKITISAPTRLYFRDFFPNRDFLEKVVPIQSLFQELVPIPKNRAKNYQKLTKLGPKCHFLTLKSIFYPSLTWDFFQSIHFYCIKQTLATINITLNCTFNCPKSKNPRIARFPYHFKCHFQLSKIKKILLARDFIIKIAFTGFTSFKCTFKGKKFKSMVTNFLKYTFCTFQSILGALSTV